MIYVLSSNIHLGCYIMEIWCCLSWSSFICMPSIWINH